MQSQNTFIRQIRYIGRRLFLMSNTTPPFLEFFITFIQFLIFTLFVSANTIEQTLIFQGQITIHMLIFLIGLVFLRFLVKLTFVKAFYVILLVWNVQLELTALTVIIYLLILLNVIIDISSKLEFSFETKNLHSETLSWFLVFHYIFLASLTMLRYQLPKKTFLFPLIQFCSFFLLILVKYRSIAKSQSYAIFNIRFYYLSVFYAIAECIEIYVVEEPLLKHSIAIVGSQLLYQLVEWKRKQNFSIEEYLSKKMELQAGYVVFSFLYSKKTLNSYIQKAMKSLSSQDNNCLIEQKTFKQTLNLQKSNPQSGFFFRQQVTSRECALQMTQILKRNNKNDVHSLLLLAQLYLFQLKQYYKCYTILCTLKYHRSSWNFYQNLLISKIQQKFYEQMQTHHDKCSVPYFYDFIQNDEFRTLLLKSTVDFINLWEYTKVKEGIYKKINQLAGKVVKSKIKIQKYYQEMQVKCIHINLLYGQYLYYVGRDISLANKIMEDLFFYQQKEVCMESSHKIYLRLSLEKPQLFSITKVSPNINKLLGWERRSIIGTDLNTFLPQFFKETHEKLLQNTLQNEFQKLFVLSKNTIIKNSRGYYETGLFCLRIGFDLMNNDGDLFLQGFLRINTDSRHNWTNFLFVKDNNNEIIQSSQSVNDKISQGKGKKFSAQEFFDNYEENDKKAIQKVTGEFSKHLYEPILTFETQQSTVYLYVEMDPYVDNIETRMKKQQQKNNKLVLPQMRIYPKIKVFRNIEHFLRKKISTEQIISDIRTKMIILGLIVLVLLLGIYVLQGVFVRRLQSQYTNKIKTMTITDNLVRHYMSLSKIAIDLSYKHLNRNFNYIFEGFKSQLKENILILQQTNFFFKKYAITQYQYQSLSSVPEYRTNFQFIAEILGSASMIDTLDDSPYMQLNMIEAYGKLFTETFVWAYSQYSSRIEVQLSQKNKNRQLQQYFMIISLFLACFIVYVLILKIESFLRVSQYETLKLIGSNTFQNELIQKCKYFLSCLTEEKFENLSNQKSIVNNLDEKNQMGNDPFKMSDMSARESTGRELMGTLSTRENWKQVKKDSQNELETQEFPIKLKPINKLVVLLPLLILLCLVTFQVLNFVLNSKMKEINQAESSKNIVAWMNKPLYFTRIVNAFMTQDHGPEVTDHDDTFYEVLGLFEKQYNSIATFQEIDYPQFQQFQTRLKQIRFEYLCTYADCPVKDRDYINILYITTMQKLANYMLQNLNFLQDPNNKMDTILVTEQLFRNIMTELINIYMKNYKTYARNYKNNQIFFVLIIVGLLSVLFVIGLIIGYVKIFKDIQKHHAVCNLIKVQSYAINQDELITFQEEENKKKIENQKKKKKKKVKSIEESIVKSHLDEKDPSPQLSGRKQKKEKPSYFKTEHIEQ